MGEHLEAVGARVEIPASVFVSLREHLEAVYPEEGCGVLLGRRSSRRVEVERVELVKNTAREDKYHRYLIAPERLLEIDREARRRGEEIVGYVHSHPDRPAEPSGTDLEGAWPDVSYVIVSIRCGKAAGCRSWRLRGERFEEEELMFSRVPPNGVREALHAEP